MKIATLKTGLGSLALLPGLALAATPAVVDKADNAFMMISTALVLFMSIPGIALFYGGLIRGKNVLSMLTQVAVTFALVCVLWVVYGYSLAFGTGNAFFGKAAPDLTLMARSRASGAGSGADYLYTYLRSFYRDDESLTGWNNTVFPSVAMPHALWELQGERKPVFKTGKDAEGKEVHEFTGKWEQVTPGTMEPAVFDQNVGDLVNYMQWMAEPAQQKRKTIGAFVLAFLALLGYFAWRLNAAYWKDVK